MHKSVLVGSLFLCLFFFVAQASATITLPTTNTKIVNADSWQFVGQLAVGNVSSLANFKATVEGKNLVVPFADEAACTAFKTNWKPTRQHTFVGTDLNKANYDKAWDEFGVAFLIGDCFPKATVAQ